MKSFEATQRVYVAYATLGATFGANTRASAGAPGGGHRVLGPRSQACRDEPHNAVSEGQQPCGRPKAREPGERRAR